MVILQDRQEHWCIVWRLLSIRCEIKYDLAVEQLNALIDEIGDNEQRPLYELLDTLGAVIYAFEEKHYAISTH
ncbi:MAG: hypothetical protein OXN17_20850 [Candidatus Poribacteria bacterium]|nr:hypothetical protein [Candidatus Poribacteria bacterium]MDE0506544.1 hypothetical protein [Candidatus Poribacteria bacterium]